MPAELSPSPLDAFRARLLQEEGWQAELARIEGLPAFVAAVVELAGAHGFSLSVEGVAQASWADPVGAHRFMPTPANATGWPPRSWLPIGVSGGGDQLCVDWAHFADDRLTEPFFEASVRRALRRPLNRFAPYRTGLGELLAGGEDDAIAPSGLIFHMSRCGSTLAAQMLAASPRNIVVSEPPPLDTVVQLDRLRPDLPEAVRVQLLVGMARALGRRRLGEERYFIKLDSWHTLALALFRGAFPHTPWVFLYRDPIEVMVSQLTQRGLQTVPGAMPEGLYGIDGGETMAPEEYCARVLERICTAALDGVGLGQGLLVNYSELPGALTTRILPHFGVACEADEAALIRGAARHNAKAPSQTFEADVERKRRQATPAIQAAVAHHLSHVYNNLEKSRLDASQHRLSDDG